MPIEDAIAAAMSKLNSTGSEPAEDTPEDVADATLDADDETDEVEESDEDLEDEDTDDDEDGEDGDSAVVELSEDTIVRIDGREGTVKDLLEMKADYTRKTQELSEDRKKVEAREAEVEQVYNQVSEWYTSRANDPIMFVGEIVRSAKDPTAVLAASLKALADDGTLDPEFVKVFGLTAPDSPVAKRASDKAADDRVAQLEARLQEREEREAQAAAEQALMAEYERQMEDIIADEDLKFESASQEQEFRIELLTFARDNDLYDNLTVAYAVMARSRAKAEKARVAQTAQATTKKRTTQVMSRKSNTPAAKPAGAEKVQGGDIEAAARLAFSRMTSGNS